MSKKISLSVRGTHCKSCEILIEKSLKKIRSVERVAVDYRSGRTEIVYRGERPNAEAIEAAVMEAGYEVGEKESLPWISANADDYARLLWAALIVAGAYYGARGLGLFELNVDTSEMGLFVVLLVGLVAGVSTCMALVGGLVLALSARHAELHPEATPMQNFRPHLYFNIGRVAGYAVLGGLIGLLGSAITPSARTLGLMTVAVGGVMLFLGLKLIEIFPVLHDKTLALPKSVSGWLGLHRENREYSHSGALTTGALTFFLPCGFTQAMQLYAVSTGSFWQGAAVMSLFALGTAPGLIGVGWLSSAFKGKKAKLFSAVAGVTVVLLGAFNIANGSQLVGGSRRPPSGAVPASADVQEVRMTEDYNGYSPRQFTVQKGKTVKWIIDAKNVYTCASQLVMPSMGIQKNLTPGENVITFTPTQTGRLPFSCSMGMYRGEFNVIDGEPEARAPAAGRNALTNLLAAAPPSPSPLGSSCGAGGGGCGCGGGNRPTTAAQPAAQSTALPADLANARTIESEYTQAYGLNPYEFTVEKGRPVKWVITLKEPPAGCMRDIVIRELGVFEPQPNSGTMTVGFQPQEAGDLAVTCAMGMTRAILHVQ